MRTPPSEEQGNDAPRRWTGKDAGMAGVTVDETRPLKPLRPGQARCPLCDRPCSVTSHNRIRAHGQCPGAGMSAVHEPVHLDQLPDVTPTRAGNRDPIIPAIEGRSALEVGSLCQVCGKWLPGERRLCSKDERAREEGRGR